MRAIVSGLIATYPAGGVAWDYGQYLLGLRRLGWDVVYLEDTGAEDVFDDEGRNYSPDAGGGVRFLADALEAISPESPIPWHLRTPDDRTYGMTGAELRDALATADLFVNVSGGALLREEYAVVPRTVLIDTDPGLNHFVNYPAADREPGWRGALGWRAHTHHFTYAERIGEAGCLLPTLGVEWGPTRPPVCLDLWSPTPPGRTWTTVMSWGSYGKVPPIVDQAGREYYAKEPEFPLIERVPAQRPALDFEVVVRDTAPVDRWTGLGWRHADPAETLPDAVPYQRWVQSSRAELSVAKNVYVATGSGWFSCRSTCYLAASRPVVTQDTGFSEVLPTGSGLFAFTSTEEALVAVDAIEADYPSHAEAARSLAEEHLSSDVVLSRLLAEVER